MQLFVSPTSPYARKVRIVARLPDAPLPVHADPVRMGQVFSNLLNNARKYSNGRGVVEVTESALQRDIWGSDGLIIATPSYHGGVSGMIKNALDYIEALRDDARPYLHGRAVGANTTVPVSITVPDSASSA